MNGVDIASYQSDLDPYALDADFIIIKVSQGTSYENPTWATQADATLGSGKLLGLYHYAAGGDATAEADYFVGLAADYVGHALLCLDWESGDNAAFGDASWCEEFLNRVVALTGTTPMLYGGQHVLTDNPSWPHWIAQYPDYTPTGYQETPWNEGAYDCEIRQYSSVGDIDGYNGNLDLDKAYISREEWLAYYDGTDGGKAAESEASMVCLIKPNGEDRLVYYDGNDLHDLDHPDEAEAINMVYKAINGSDIPTVELGTQEAPYYTRFRDAVVHRADGYPSFH